MKKFSFKLKITIFTTLIITAVCAVALAALLIVGNSTAQAQAKEMLTDLILQNADEPEYINGILSFGDEFSYFKDGMYCDIYSENFEYLSGQTPHSLIDFANFENDRLLKHEIASKDYYICDKRLDFSLLTYEIDAYSGEVVGYRAETLLYDEQEETEINNTDFGNGISTKKAIETAISHAGTTADNVKIIETELSLNKNTALFRITFKVSEPVLPCIWIRGTVPCEKITTASSSVFRGFLYITPLLILLAAASAYIISMNTMKPIEEIRRSAKSISLSGDLSERIDIGKGKDEIHELAQTFNFMLDRLERSFKSEKQFTSDASHELRTPLAVIKAECDFALSEYADDNDKTQALISVNEQTDKMAALVSSLLSLTRAEQGTEKYILERLNLSEQVNGACDGFVSQKGIILNRDIAENIYILMDTSLIARMLQNIISNAEKYGKENGYINVSLTKSGNEAVISVKDNGIGIKPDELERIWDRFYRADASRSKAEGFGLGLAIVKKIVDIHSGSVEVKSTFGEGSEFIFRFKAE